MIQTKNLWKTYGSGDTQVNALRGVDLTVNKGDFLALVGPSGCGKSTLLHMLGAMDTPSRGEIMLEGRELGKLGEGQLTDVRLERLGFIFQTFNLVPTLNALENVMLPMKFAGISRREAKQKALCLLDMVGLKERTRHLPAQMSGGQRQRVAIARALANDPALILADEPTGNLDSENSEKIMELLQNLNRKGRTIVMVTHNPELAERVNRVVYMKDGQLAELQRNTKDIQSA
ncbi:MAG: ABC transporter ATP-binding protein [Clostridia bacterium]|nr:ABC transporter ATP-binding protein [Clostridia bacterium]